MKHILFGLLSYIFVRFEFFSSVCKYRDTVIKNNLKKQCKRICAVGTSKKEIKANIAEAIG